MQKEIEHLRRRFRESRTELFRNVKWSAPSRDLLQNHALLVDGLLKEIYEISCRSADCQASRSRHSGLAIVATGGYGREELNPYSDIDIAFIPSEEEDPWVEALVHTAFKLVMDSFLSLKDIHVGYAFRPIAEANAWDVPTKTALLDLRYICGDRVLADSLQDRIRDVLSPLDLMLEAVLREGKQRKRISSLYSVEPGVKEGPGSLRDLHRARWIFKLLLEVDDSGLASALRDRAGISDRQMAEILEAADWFWRVRTWMHLTAGKLSDVLISNYQDRIARELGGCTAQEWLSKHIAHSEVLARFRESAIRTLLQGPLQIEGVRLENGSLHLQGRLSNAVKMLHLSQIYAIPISLQDQRLLADARSGALDVPEPTPDEVWALNQILSQHRGAAATLRSLLEFGILDRFIPGFSSVTRFVPPDPAHQFTVGEHSIRMIEHLETLFAGTNPEEQGFSDLLRQCSHFDMLVLASLLHDAGKLLPGADHSESSAELAKLVSARLNLAPEKREILDIIVRRHLLLVRTARLHDLKSPNVIRKVAEQVPGMEALRHLYVFTYVDTFAVAEKNWTSMDSRDLEELYQKMQEFFEGAEAGIGGLPEEKSALVRKKLVALRTSKNEAAVLKHCDAMPAGYVLNTPMEEISFHLQLLERLESERVVLDIYNRPGDDFTELTLSAYDDPQPGMLSKITGVLYGCNIDIHRAQAFTIRKERPVVLDTLWIRSNGMQIAENRARRIQSALKEVLSGVTSIEQYLQKAGKTPPDGILLDSIDLRNDLSEEHTVVHIVAGDLQGLLYLMTRSLSRCGLHIHSAKIATWNARAENNFYVTAANGGQLPDLDLPAWTDRLSRALKGDV